MTKVIGYTIFLSDLEGDSDSNGKLDRDVATAEEERRKMALLLDIEEKDIYLVTKKNPKKKK